MEGHVTKTPRRAGSCLLSKWPVVTRMLGLPEVGRSVGSSLWIETPREQDRHDFSIEGCSDGVEVALLATPQSQAGLNQIVTILRTIADVQHIFTHSGAPQGVAFRGCAPQVQLADCTR